MLIYLHQPLKLLIRLVGLETGKIRDEKMVIKWDGKTRSDTGMEPGLDHGTGF